MKNPDMPNHMSKSIGILTNDYAYAQQWLFDNRPITHFNVHSHLHTDVTGQTYVIATSAQRFLSCELLTVFVISNPERPFISNHEIIDAKSRIR